MNNATNQPTIHEVAKEAGVSTATVSRVINGLGNVKQETVERVLTAIQKTGYIKQQKKEPQLQVHENGSKIIGLICADIASPMLMDILKILEAHLRRYDYSVMVMNSNEDPELERRQLRLMAERNVEAIIAYSTGRNEDLIYEIWLSGIPILLMDRRPRMFDLPAVYTDKGYGMYEALEYLMKDLGHERIGIITADPEIPTNEDRLRGLKKFFKDHPECSDKELLWEYGDFSQEFGYEASGRLLVKGVTAIVACSSHLCVGVLSYCKNNQIQIPQEVSLISFGAFTNASLISPRITYIGDRNADVAAAMIDWVCQIIVQGRNGGMKKVYLPRLIIEESCAPRA
ncbi:MAG: LacI family DNA-binding transcriptional regulator [Lachnospiraceae bacterium]|nr:LacI family DNA-binding transcriptional regulator [Lachnospiraceae bacterium]